jgi:RNA polymerase sigma-70 factor (ECF subfamily)
MSSDAARFIPPLFGSETEGVHVELEGAQAAPVRATAASRSASADDRGSDESLITGICAGDREALVSLFRRYARLVRAVAYRILRDEAEADDLLQEVFLFIQRKSEAFDSSKSSARSWIVNIAYERAIDRRRYLNTRHFYTSLGIDDSALQIADQRASVAKLDAALDAALAKEGLEKALMELSDGQRDTLRLYFFEGYTLAEIAAKLDQSLGNVRNHYYRGLEKMRNQLLPKQLRRR